MEKQPRSRLDDCVKEQESKIKFILSKTRELGASAILQPGDFCDSWKHPDKFKTRFMKIFRDAPQIIVVSGQHDQRYHTSDIENTPLGVLSEALNFKLLQSNSDIHKINSQVFVYGAGWGQDIPKVTTKGFNILLTHRMVIMDKIWEGQEHYDVAGSLLRRHKFDLIVSGDNHKSFHYKHQDRWLINCGSLMRTRIDQVDHEPCIWSFDTETRKAKQIHIPIKPFDEIMNIEMATKEKERNEKLDKLAESMKNRSRITGLNFRQRISDRVKELKRADKLDERTELIIERVMEDD
jgi:predicted phosphodiesterase